MIVSLNTATPAVYPRWRGEHLEGSTLSRSEFGLSPLARGTRVNRIRQLITRRFIPAGAGNTVKNELLPIDHTVYPRWRGEHLHHSTH